MLGGSNTPMTQLKEHWRGMPEAEREEWRDLFVSNLPSVEIREKIKAEMNIDLPRDSQLCRFRDWAEKELDREEVKDSVKEDERYWEEQFGGKDNGLEKARQKLLKRSYANAMRKGNYPEALATMREDVRLHRYGLEGRKVEVIERRAEAQADPDGYLADCNLTDEERAQKIKGIYGRA